MANTWSGTDRRIDAVRRERVSKMSREELERELLTDHLTGAPNKRAFEDWCGLVNPTFIAAIDVDALKWVNDEWGHEAGDDLLCAVVRAARDLGIGIFRLGGDEFAVTFEDHEDAFALMHRLQKKLRTEMFSAGTDRKGQRRGHAWGARFSFGVGRTLHAADQMLQQMKRERTTLGIRPPRGERPTGLCVVSQEELSDTLVGAI